MIREEFERVTPESVGIHSEDIEWLVDQLEGDFTEPHGLMIMKHGKSVRKAGGLLMRRVSGMENSRIPKRTQRQQWELLIQKEF